MNYLSKARASLHQLLALYESSGGRSIDDYDAEVRVHPMAEGKYLSTLMQLWRAGYVNDKYVAHNAQTVMERLESLNVARQSDQACWGLGFPFREAPADEPYVITTAIVTQGILELPPELGDSLASRALRWLRESAPRTVVQHHGRPIEFLVFSEHIPELITNVALAGAATLHRAGQLPEKDAIIEWARMQYCHPLGWPYAQGNNRIDLLHQCYILNALADMNGAASIEDEALRVVGLFASGDGYLDVVSLMPGPPRIEWSAASQYESFMQYGADDWLIRHAARARDWSLGELLVVLSRLVEHGRERAQWRVVLRQLLARVPVVLASHIEAAERNQARFRHSMHLAHGVASALQSLRSSKNVTAPTTS